MASPSKDEVAQDPVATSASEESAELVEHEFEHQEEVEELEEVVEVEEEEEEEDVTETDAGADPHAQTAPVSTAPIAAHGQPGDTQISARVVDEARQASVQSLSVQATGEKAPVAGTFEDLKVLEVQATKVAKEVQEVAKDVSKKLSEGLTRAFGGAADATTSLSKFAGGFASWWNTMDAPQQQASDELTKRLQASGKASSEIQTLFSLTPEEHLVEQFKCKLLQTYACNHNTYTPAIQMAFQGTLYITDKHTCFNVEERGRNLPFKLPHTAITRCARQLPSKGQMSDVLRLELAGGEGKQHVAFKDFESGSALDSALALIEHLTSAS